MYKTGVSLAATGVAGYAAHNVKIAGVPVPIAALAAAALVLLGALAMRVQHKLKTASQPEATKR